MKKDFLTQMLMVFAIFLTLTVLEARASLGVDDLEVTEAMRRVQAQQLGSESEVLIGEGDVVDYAAVRLLIEGVLLNMFQILGIMDELSRRANQS